MEELQKRTEALREQKKIEVHKFFIEKREKEYLENAYKGIFDTVELIKEKTEKDLKKVEKLDETIQLGGMCGLKAAFEKRRLLADILYKFEQEFRGTYLQISAIRSSGSRNSLVSKEKIDILDKKLSVIGKETMKYQKMKEMADSEVNKLIEKSDLRNKKNNFNY